LNDLNSNGGYDKEPLPGNGERPAENAAPYLREEPEANPKSGVKKLVLKYILILGCALLIFIIAFGSIYLILSGKGNSSDFGAIPTAKPNGLSDHEGADDQYTGENSSIFDNLFSAPRKTNFLIIGVDQGGTLSDVTIAGSFDSYTKKIDLISIPRDTYIEIDKWDIDDLAGKGRWMPSSGKLTDMHSFAGKDYGHDISVKYVERMLGVDIDFYVEIDLKAFREIVDSVGGIYMDIRSQGYNYNDPDQNLHIYIPGGKDHLLNGIEAEGLVRFRDGYLNGDIGRIAVQQEFMKAFFTQVLEKDTIMNNLQSYIKTYLSYVKTDFQLTATAKYIAPLKDLTADSINFYMLPGKPGTNDAMWYEEPEQIKDLVAATFLNYDLGLPDNIKNLKIQVLNGGNTSNGAEKAINALKAVGYTNIIDGGDYSGTFRNETRIIVEDEANDDPLKQLFQNPRIEIDSGDLPDDFDVVIIIGRN
jgi:LCP family protein required for cell wall assembly